MVGRCWCGWLGRKPGSGSLVDGIPTMAGNNKEAELLGWGLLMDGSHGCGGGGEGGGTNKK